MDIYTHKFKFSVSDGGKFLHGEVEFNTDGKVSYKFKGMSEPLEKEVLVKFNELMELVKVIFNQFGGIKEIKIIDKTIEP